MTRRGEHLVDCNGDEVGTWAGFVMARRDPETKTVVVVIDDRSGLWSHDSLRRDADGRTAPWWTVCDDHGCLCQHTTRALAEGHAMDPCGWCEPCAEKREDQDHE